MAISIRDILLDTCGATGLDPSTLMLPDAAIDPDHVRVLMINEAPPARAEDWFYSRSPAPADMQSVSALFRLAGTAVDTIDDLLRLGIYLTTAIKTPKTAYAVDNAVLSAHLPLLKAELYAFPHLQAVMAMGDVAKKAVNLLAKPQTKRNVFPSEATCRIRDKVFMWGNLRAFASYIVTGSNLLIEPGKRGMIAEDIQRMFAYIQ